MALRSLVEEVESDDDLPFVVDKIKRFETLANRRLQDYDSREMSGDIDERGFRHRQHIQRMVQQAEQHKKELFDSFPKARQLYEAGSQASQPEQPQGPGLLSRMADAITPSEKRLRGIGEGIEKVGQAITSVPGVGKALDIISYPGEKLRGVLTGQPGKSVSPSELVDKWSEGGTEQVLRERGPGAATIRDTAAGFVDPLLGLPMLLRRFRRPQQKPAPRSEPPAGPEAGTGSVAPPSPGAGPKPTVGPLTAPPVGPKVKAKTKTETTAASLLKKMEDAKSGKVVSQAEPQAVAHQEPVQPLAGKQEVVEPTPSPKIEPPAPIQPIEGGLSVGKSALLERAKKNVVKPDSAPPPETPVQPDVTLETGQADVRVKESILSKPQVVEPKVESPLDKLTKAVEQADTMPIVEKGVEKPLTGDLTSRVAQQAEKDTRAELIEPKLPVNKEINTPVEDTLTLPGLVNKAKGQGKKAKAKPVAEPPPDVVMPEVEVTPEPKLTPKAKGKASGKIAVSKSGTEMTEPTDKNPFILPRASIVKGGKQIERWAYDNGYLVRRIGEKIQLRDDVTQEIKYEFLNTREGREAMAKKLNEEHVVPAEGKPTILYGGVPITEAPRAAKALYESLKRQGKSLFTEGTGPKNKLSPLTRAWKTPAAHSRLGGEHEKVIDLNVEAERKIKELVDDFRFKEKADGGYEQKDYETFDRLRGSELEPVRKAIHHFDAKDEMPTPEQLEQMGLNKQQVQAVLGTQEAARDAYALVKRELIDSAMHRLGRKTGSLTPKELMSAIDDLPMEDRAFVKEVLDGVGKRKFYYPHKFLGAYEVFSVNPTTGERIKLLVPEGEAKGSSTFKTRRQANLFVDDMSSRYGIPSERLEVVDHSKLGFGKHLEHRKGEVGYELHDVQGAYSDYLYEAMHWTQIRKLVREVNDLLSSSKSNLSKADKEFLLKYTERVAGKPAAVDTALNNFVREVPAVKNIVEPYVPFSTMIKSARKTTTFLKLGAFNPSAAIINLDGLTRHVWPGFQRLSNVLQLGDPFAAEKYLKQGMQAWLSNISQKIIEKVTPEETLRYNTVESLAKAMGLNRENHNLLQKLAHKGVLDIQMFGEPLPSAHDKASKAYRAGMIMFSTIEDLSRSTSTVGAFKMARAAGRTEEEALKIALKFTGETLGRYTKAGKPMVYTSELGAGLGIFKTYLHVMLDNSYLNLRHPWREPGAFLRYAASAVGVSGVLGLIPGIKDIDDLLTSRLGFSPEEQVARTTPDWLASGLPNLVGVDVSERSAAPDIVPNSVKDLGGALYSTFAEPVIGMTGAFVDAAENLAKGEPTHLSDDSWEVLKKLMPNTIGAKYLIEKADSERLMQRRGRTVIKDLTSGEHVYKSLGLPLSREMKEQRQYRINENKKQHIGPEREKLIDAYIAGDEDTIANWGQLRRRYGISWQMIQAERKRKRQTLTERQHRSMPKAIRQEEQIYPKP